MSNDGKIKMSVARFAPSWIKWAGYAISLGFLLGYILVPGLWIVYALAVYSTGLVYWSFLCYNQFVEYYNGQQIKGLDWKTIMKEAIEQEDGTFCDKDGLIKEKTSEKDASTDANRD